MPHPAHRCLLFAPGGRPELLEKAHRSTADALIFDLEDSVTRDTKDQARRNVAAALGRNSGLPVYVRVNHESPEAFSADLDALAPVAGSPLLEGILLPKASDGCEVMALDRYLTDLERVSGRRAAPLSILPLIEDCRGVRNAFELASASSRVVGMSLASAEEGDLMLDLGGRWTPGSRALAYARGKLVCDARAAGIGWLIDGAFMNLRDGAALRQESAIARELGFTAKMALHPGQVPAILEIFSPTAEEVERARALIEAFREAEAAGSGAINHRGGMVDYANVRIAERLLARAGVSRPDQVERHLQ